MSDGILHVPLKLTITGDIHDRPFTMRGYYVTVADVIDAFLDMAREDWLSRFGDDYAVLVKDGLCYWPSEARTLAMLGLWHGDVVRIAPDPLEGMTAVSGGVKA